MKKPTEKRERSKTRTPGAGMDADALAILEQQQRDVEELISSFHGTNANDDSDSENE